MPQDDLKNLPTEVKTLINDGVYSLYRVKNIPGVAYVLLVGPREFYALTSDGAVVEGAPIRSVADAELGAPEFFKGMEPRPALKLNYAV